MQITAVLEEHLEQMAANGRASSTLAQVRRHGLALARWAAQERLSGKIEELTPQHVAHFLVAQQGLPGREGLRTASTVNALRSSLRGFFRFLLDAGYVARDPTRLVKPARCASLPPRGLSVEDQARLLAYLRDGASQSATAGRDCMLVALALATGLRLGSLLGLDVQDVDLDTGELVVRVVKGGRPMVVPLGPGIVEHLEDYVETLDPEAGPLFRSRSGKRLGPRQVQQRLRHAGKRAGLRRLPSPHDLRRTFGVCLYARTQDLLLVQAALGHAAIGSTLRYAAADQQRLRDVLRAL